MKHQSIEPKYPEKYENGLNYFYDSITDSYVVGNRMEFTVEGVKSKPGQEYITYKELMTYSKKRVRQIQRHRVTNIRFGVWWNLSDNNKTHAYNKAGMRMPYIFAN